jgi:hypothetical protein
MYCVSQTRQALSWQILKLTCGILCLCVHEMQILIDFLWYLGV